MRNGFSMLGMALETTKMCAKSHRYVGNGKIVLEMALEFDKRLKYVGYDECMWEMA